MNAHKKMLMVSRTLVCLLSAYVLLFATGGSARADSIWHGNTIPLEIEKKANRLMHDLTKKGFEVSRGYFKLWTVDDCEYTEKKVGVCYGNNPAAPYVVSTVLPWPEEYWEEDTDDPYYGRSNIWGVSDEGYIDVYRFDSREAIIIFGPFSLSRPGPLRGRGILIRIVRHTGTFITILVISSISFS